MIIITEREVSNGHGTGVLLKNIVHTINERNNFVLCTHSLSAPESSIPHYFLDDYSFYRGSRIVRKLLLNKFGAALYFKAKKNKLNQLSVEKQSTVFIVFSHPDVMWRTLKFIKLFPDKKYILFLMDNFIDFDDPEEGSLCRKAITFISKNAYKRIAISNNLALDLEEITGTKFETFYGPRLINWNSINRFHLQQKEHKICFVGNAWVEEVLPAVDEQLRLNNFTVTWFTNQNKFETLQQKYKLTSFVFGGDFSSEDVLEVIAGFRYGLILYGLEFESLDFFYNKIQEYSIPSKLIDYCISGIEPVYYGPFNSACFNFLSENDLGILTNKSNFEEFLDNFDILSSKPIDSEKMKNVVQRCTTDRFLQLIKD